MNQVSVCSEAPDSYHAATDISQVLEHSPSH